MNIKLSTAQQLMLHVLESTIASVVITVVIGAIQYLSTHGLNLAGLGATCVTLFVGALSMGYKSVSGNPNFGQALLDSLNEIKGLLPLQNTQPPVVVNVQHPAEAVPAPAQPSVQVTPSSVNSAGATVPSVLQFKTATPVGAMQTGIIPPDRHFGDSQIIPAVNPQ